MICVVLGMKGTNGNLCLTAVNRTTIFLNKKDAPAPNECRGILIFISTTLVVLGS